MFTKVNHTSTLYTGTLETEMGGLVYYGFDTSKGLMWLERSPKEKYSKVDDIWNEAETFLISSTKGPQIAQMPLDGPKTITRSIAANYNMGSAEYTAYDEEEHTGRAALESYETENDKVFAKVEDNDLIRHANELLQVGLEEY